MIKEKASQHAENLRPVVDALRSEGVTSLVRLERPPTSLARRRAVVQAREAGGSIRQIAGELRMSTATVQQVLREGAAQAA